MTSPVASAFGYAADIPLAEYPRPQLARDSYLCLNGHWNYAFTAEAQPPAAWDGEILVPYSPEAQLSGVGRQLDPTEYLWYERTLKLPAGFRKERLLLHFGAVDQDCVVYLDGVQVGAHEGGYLPFTVDLTHAIGDDRAAHTLRVRVRDVTDQSYRSRGKQSLNRGGIWYTPQSGIWQTVWLESVAEAHVERLQIRPVLTDNPAESFAEITVHAPAATVPVEVIISESGVEVARAQGPAGETLRLPIPEVRPWSPADPFLYDVEVRLCDDVVTSYLGMRSVGIAPDALGKPRMMLNGTPYFHCGVLDQGYWPDGLYTPANDAALVRDIQAMKDLGFTMLRKHIKIEPLRWYYHCDRLGMLVWQDMVSGGERYKPLVITAPVLSPIKFNDRRYGLFGRADAAGRAEFLAELDATIELLQNAPSVVTWVPFNEAWGQFDANEVAQRVRRLDPDRIIDHASGWHDQGGGQLRSLHVYFRPIKPRRNWGADGRAVVVSEYGGYALRLPGHEFSEREFGYRRYATGAELTAAYAALHREQIAPAIDAGLSAMVYTQLSDVEDELNGILTYDRTVTKVDARVLRQVNQELHDRFAAATAGMETAVGSGSAATLPPVSPGAVAHPGRAAAAGGAVNGAAS
ncbi:hypothetical protein JOF28_000092 [Leucobacter exalbidus]|uniref:Glycoside hydrolase family 2 n=1 Tax=Leucobacter exalbidus TaxID=662960 RepID=A0A940PRF3_9MICO|nr:sugar-binding domain-containing protein [Leucobacter exalbidus]MBP1324860.1 hypothetical protein [Leucobacter exalbidus]